MSSPSYPAIIIPLQEHYHGNTSYPFNAKIMVVAVATLLVITSFVLLLHVYAKWWFFTRSRGRRLSIPHLPPPPPPPMLSQLLHRRHTVGDDVGQVADHGLDPLVISRLPTFVCKWDGSGTSKAGLECVVCLSLFEENEKGRMLPNCHHAFHVDCIDMWLMSHSTCPLCRNNVVVGNVEEAASELQISPSPAVVADSSMGNGISLDGNVSLMLEFVVEDTQASNSKDSFSSSSSSSSSSCTLGESLKRILSRSRSESRVFPSSDHVIDR